VSGTGATGRPGRALSPADATDGWECAGTPGTSWLTKDYGEYLGRVTPTAGATCVWRIGRPDGTMLRESSARDLGEAKALADAWVARRSAE
jgi:hypothetical protein